MSITTVSSDLHILLAPQPQGVCQWFTDLISSIWESIKTWFSCCYRNESAAAPAITSATTTPTVPATTTAIVPETRAETRPTPPTATAPLATETVPSPAESAQRRGEIATRLHEILPNNLSQRDGWLKRFVWDVYELETRLRMHVTLGCIWRDGFFCLQIGATGKTAEELHRTVRFTRGFLQLSQTAPSNPLILKIDSDWFYFRSPEELNQVAIPTTPNKTSAQIAARRNTIHTYVSSQLPGDVTNRPDWVSKLTDGILNLETRLNIPVFFEIRTYQVEDEDVEGGLARLVYLKILVKGVHVMELMGYAEEIPELRGKVSTFLREQDRLGRNNASGLNPETLFTRIQ